MYPPWEAPTTANCSTAQGRAAVLGEMASNDGVADNEGFHLSAPHAQVGHAGAKQQDDRS